MFPLCFRSFPTYVNHRLCFFPVVVAPLTRPVNVPHCLSPQILFPVVFPVLLALTQFLVFHLSGQLPLWKHVLICSQGLIKFLYLLALVPVICGQSSLVSCLGPGDISCACVGSGEGYHDSSLQMLLVILCTNYYGFVHFHCKKIALGQ